ncbi:YqaA family protein [Methanocaldococcus infernus]
MNLKEIFLNLVKEYGYLGIFIIGFSEPIFQPFPVEIFIAAALLLGLNWFLVLIISTVASNLGAMVTYFLAKRFGEGLIIKLVGEDNFKKASEFLEKYGILGVLIVSFTPIPFEAICWVCGLFEMPFNKYMIAVFISRLIRHGIVILLYLLYKGVTA